MESHARYIIVGIAVVVFVVLVIASVLWLSEAGMHRDAEYYTVYFEEHTLDGLQIDSYVTMKGIRVGSVVDLQISPRNIEQVKVLIQLEEGTPVKTDTKAVINRNLLTGLAFIDLIGSTQEAKRLRQIPRGEDYPVIPEGRSEFKKIASTIPQVVDQVEEMVRKANAVLSEENRDNFSKLLVNLERASRAFADKEAQIGQTILHLESFAGELSSIGKSLDEFSRNLSRFTKESGPQISESLRSVSAAAAGINEETRKVSSSLRRSSELLVNDAHELTERLSTAAEKIAVAVESFENPRTIITGPSADSLGPGETLGR